MTIPATGLPDPATTLTKAEQSILTRLLDASGPLPRNTCIDPTLHHPSQRRQQSEALTSLARRHVVDADRQEGQHGAAPIVYSINARGRALLRLVAARVARDWTQEVARRNRDEVEQHLRMAALFRQRSKYDEADTRRREATMAYDRWATALERDVETLAFLQNEERTWRDLCQHPAQPAQEEVLPPVRSAYPEGQTPPLAPDEPLTVTLYADPLAPGSPCQDCGDTESGGLNECDICTRHLCNNCAEEHADRHAREDDPDWQDRLPGLRVTEP